MKNDYTNKKVAILGYGVNNAELVPWLQSHGASVTICDKNALLSQDLPDVSYQIGPDYLKNLTEFDFLFRTPGLPYLTPEIQAAKQAGVVVTSQTQLFLEQTSARTIGVTGTKGKGTTASLIEAMLQAARHRDEIAGNVYLAGNIGVSPISLLKKLASSDWVILELSSFQTQDLTLSPHIAVILAVTQDHLDHHKSLEEYVAAKRNLVVHQGANDYVVVNHDSPTSMSFLDATHARPYLFSSRAIVETGAYVTPEGDIRLHLSEQVAVTVCRAAEIKLPGRHNLENIAAATVAAALAGAGVESLRHGATTFEGLPHHLQLVATKRGVRYYDDSFSTNPTSTIAALRSFVDPQTIILGGSSKGADFTELVNELKQSSVTDVILIGKEGARLKPLLREASGSWHLHDGGATMTDIVATAARVTKRGGIVLLSPAAASLDMFSNYKDRGDQFAAAAQALEE